MKICDTCGHEKKKIYFYFDNKSEDKRSSTCMACVNHRKKMDKKKLQKKVKNDKRRKAGSENLILYKRRSNSKTSQKIFRADPTPVLFQFNHLIYKHVKDKYGLSFSQINLLMMVAPIAPFPRREFLACREIMEYREIGLMKMFIDNNFVYIWRKQDKINRVPTLYDLTQKGRDLISDIHDWALCKKPIPEVNENKALDLMARLYQSKKGTTP